jgi:UDP-N-acetylmuramoyl-L-alanyl-D-glutamate--2,6-diaminopimelate ligase
MTGLSLYTYYSRSCKLNWLLSEMVKDGCSTALWKSAATRWYRNVQGLSFACGIFTNISHDHLDYHKTFREYMMPKNFF